MPQKASLKQQGNPLLIESWHELRSRQLGKILLHELVALSPRPVPRSPDNQLQMIRTKEAATGQYTEHFMRGQTIS